MLSQFWIPAARVLAMAAFIVGATATFCSAQPNVWMSYNDQWADGDENLPHPDVFASVVVETDVSDRFTVWLVTRSPSNQVLRSVQASDWFRVAVDSDLCLPWEPAEGEYGNTAEWYVDGEGDYQGDIPINPMLTSLVIDKYFFAGDAGKNFRYTRCNPGVCGQMLHLKGDMNNLAPPFIRAGVIRVNLMLFELCMGAIFETISSC